MDTVSRYGKGDLNVGEEILDMVKQSSGLIRGNLGIGHRNQYHDIVKGTRFVGGGNLVHDRRPKGVDCGSSVCKVEGRFEGGDGSLLLEVKVGREGGRCEDGEVEFQEMV